MYWTVPALRGWHSRPLSPLSFRPLPTRIRKERKSLRTKKSTRTIKIRVRKIRRKGGLRRVDGRALPADVDGGEDVDVDVDAVEEGKEGQTQRSTRPLSLNTTSGGVPLLGASGCTSVSELLSLVHLGNTMRCAEQLGCSFRFHRLFVRLKPLFCMGRLGQTRFSVTSFASGSFASDFKWHWISYLRSPFSDALG